MNRALALVVCLLTLSAGSAFALFGLGDIVFDPTNYAEAIEQVLQLERQYQQLIQTYQTIRSQYDHMVYMARQVPVNMASRYRTLAAPWRNSSAADTYGTTGAWIAGINSGSGIDAAYSHATEALASYGAALGNVPSDQLGRLKTSYATVELTDGANRSAMDTIGRLRANGPADDAAISALESDSLSSSPDMNTEIAVLNKINAAGVIAVRSSQDTNKLLVALAEQQVVSAKRQRDSEAEAINAHVRFMQDGKAAMASQAANASSAMRSWRMP